MVRVFSQVSENQVQLRRLPQLSLLITVLPYGFIVFLKLLLLV